MGGKSRGRKKSWLDFKRRCAKLSDAALAIIFAGFGMKSAQDFLARKFECKFQFKFKFKYIYYYISSSRNFGVIDKMSGIQVK